MLSRSCGDTYIKTLLALLYVIQGLPHGIQLFVVPLRLRGFGMSLTEIGSLSLLFSPWTLKPLWAPLLETYYFSSVGKRRTWLLPLLLLLLPSFYLIEIFLSNFEPTLSSSIDIFVLLLTVNFITATLDIVVDGLAVDFSSQSPIGSTNVIQVVGYKVGMMLSGGLLATYCSTQTETTIITGVLLTALLAVFFYPEKREQNHISKLSSHQNRSNNSLKTVLVKLWSVLTDRKSLPVIFIASTYKLGETVIDAMFKPFLFDSGFSERNVLILTGFYGMIISICGSLSAVLVLNKYSSRSMLSTFFLIRIIPLSMKVAVTVMPIDLQFLQIVIGLDNWVGGMITPIVFSYMMENVYDHAVGGSHFTVLASLEVIPKVFIVPPLTGFCAQSFGYFFSFVIGLFLSFIPLLFCIFYKH